MLIDEHERLEERISILAREKSYLQLITHMMQRISRLPGLENIVENLLRTVLDCIGGTNLIVYYRVETRYHICDVFGQRTIVDEISDPLVLQVLTHGEPLEIEHSPADTRLLTTDQIPASTWLYPLKIGAEPFGVFKMESLHIGTHEWAHLLPTFFNYAALLLNNEILSHTRLARTHEQLRKEITAHKQTLEDLRAAKAELELNYELQTERLKITSGSLSKELLQRRKAEEALQRSEARYRDLFEYSSVPVWEEDFSQVKTFFDALRSNGVCDFDQYFTQHPEELAQCAAMVQVLDVNLESLRMFNVASKEEVITYLPYYFTPRSMRAFQSELVALAQGATHFTSEIEIHTPHDELRTLDLHLTVVAGHEDSLKRVHVSFLDITDQKRISRALQESETRFRTMFASSPMSVELFNAEGLLIDANQACLDLFEVTDLERVRGFRLWDDPNVKPETKTRLQNGEIIHSEILYDFDLLQRYNPNLSPRRGKIYIEATITPLTGADNAFEGIMVQVQDISARKEAEEALHRNQIRLQNAERVANLGSWEIDILSGRQVWSDQTYRIYGLQPGRLEANWKNGLRRIHPEDRRRVGRAIQQAIDESTPFALEYRILRPDKKMAWVDTRGEVERDAWDSPLKVTGSVMEITERKQALDALSQSEELFRQLAENVRDLMWVRDYATRGIVYLNPAGEEILGITCEEAYANPEAILRVLHPDDFNRFQEAVQKQYSGSFIDDLFRVLRADGELRWVRLRSYPVRGPDGIVYRIAGIGEDITQAYQAEQLARLERQRTESLLKISQNNSLTFSEIERFAAQQILDLTGSSLTMFLLRGADREWGLCGWLDLPNNRLVRFSDLEEHPVNARWLERFTTQEDAFILTPEERHFFINQLVPGQIPQMDRAILFPYPQNNAEISGAVILAGKESEYNQAEAHQVAVMLTEIAKILERRADQDRLQASLLEKNALIKEIHHRVKNNMQVMISLLDMQALRVEDPLIRDMFEECKNRIRSMALVHEQLYASNSLAQIDFGAYITRLAWDLFSAYRITSDIHLSVEAEPILLSIETAIPCGLIINELVTNALKHAFPAGRHGQVRVRLQREENEVVLGVSDDGIGLPPGLDPIQSDTLGLKLISLLTRQVSGHAVIDCERGYSYELRFHSP